MSNRKTITHEKIRSATKGLAEKALTKTVRTPLGTIVNRKALIMN